MKIIKGSFIQEFASFAPIVPERAKILILGSIPGVRSVEQGQYYAHPQNAFWPMLSRIYPEFACDAEQWQRGRHHQLPFVQKVRLLEAASIALWDVLASAWRQNSTDQSIQGEICNPVARLLQECASIQKILLNGKKSAKLFSQKILPEIESQNYRIYHMPSSSPAYASLGFDAKTAAWRQALRPAKHHNPGAGTKPSALPFQ